MGKSCSKGQNLLNNCVNEIILIQRGCLPMTRGYMHVYDHHFQRFSSLKPLGELKPNLVCSIRDASSDDNQADIIEAFNSTSRYLDDLHKIDNPFFVEMLNQIYPPELQLNKVNTLGIDASLFGFISIFFQWFCLL